MSKGHPFLWWYTRQSNQPFLAAALHVNADHWAPFKCAYIRHSGLITMCGPEPEQTFPLNYKMLHRPVRTRLILREQNFKCSTHDDFTFGFLGIFIPWCQLSRCWQQSISVVQFDTFYWFFIILPTFCVPVYYLWGSTESNCCSSSWWFWYFNCMV